MSFYNAILLYNSIQFCIAMTANITASGFLLIIWAAISHIQYTVGTILSNNRFATLW